jgi:TonB family protein
MKLLFKCCCQFLFIILLSGCTDETLSNQQAVEIPGSCEVTNVPYGAPVVKIKFTVTENGIIDNKSISQTSGYKNIDDIALKNIDTCKYTPLIINSKPQTSLVERTYTWTQNIAK